MPADPLNDPFLTHTHAQAPPQGSTMARAGTMVSKMYRGKKRKELVYDASMPGPIVCITILALFSFCYHIAPEMVWLAVLFCGYAVFAVLPPNPNGALFIDWVPTYTVLFAILFATVVGILNFELYMHPFFQCVWYAEYSNVLPSEGVASHSDAGKIVWAASTKVDTTKSVGYRDKFTYCVAPVVDESDMSKVGYWAAGYDCCSARGQFWCDDAGFPMAFGSVPFVEPVLLGNSHDGFHEAIKMAEAVYGIHADKSPMLVRWVEDPVYTEQMFMYAGGLMFAIAAGASMIGGVVMSVWMNNAADRAGRG